jgi:hypothetical protein
MLWRYNGRVSKPHRRDHPRRPLQAGSVDRRPRVIVDFEVDEDHLLVVVVRNIGDLPATRVRIRFNPTFRGLGGEIVVPHLSLFRRLSFLAPGREIGVPVDPVAHYLGRCEPEEPRVIGVAIHYRDLHGRRYRTRLRHDLGIWEDLPRMTTRSHGDRT